MSIKKHNKTNARYVFSFLEKNYGIQMSFNNLANQADEEEKS